MVCEFCGASDFQSHSAREMMFGTREVFEYKECSQCGCLRITQVPQDLGRHYPSNSYPCFIGQKRSLKNRIRQKLVTTGIYHPFITRLTHSFYPLDMVELGHLIRLRPELKTLDVGCGGGRLVADHHYAGFDIVGIDAFAGESGIVRRGEMKDVTETFDRILFNHSLEHMPDQVAALVQAGDRLNPNGQIVVRIPIASWAWKEYGTDWVQLDAPRHLCLHTEKSFRLSAEKAGLKVTEVLYDSFEFQFWGSELYRRDIPLEVGRQRLKDYFPASTMAGFRSRAAELNQQGMGDQAVFFLSK